MTISTTTSRASYNGNGVTTVFSVPFRFFASTDLVVELVTVSTGASTTLTLTTHYTVTGADDESGGSLTMLTAPAVGQRLVIRRVITATQEVDYVAGDPFPAETHERALDRLTMLAQQGEEVNARALVFPSGDTANGELPEVVTRASKLLGFNASGDLTVSAPASGSAAELTLDLASPASGKGAEMVAYASATVADKLGEAPSFDDYLTEAELAAALSGSVVDMTTSMNTALAAHKVVRAVAGRTYRFTTLNIAQNDAGIHLEVGAKLMPSNAAITALNITGQRCTIYGGGIIESPATFNAVNARRTYATVWVTGEGFTIKGVTLQNVPRSGIHFEDATGWAVDGVTINGGFPYASFTGTEVGHCGVDYNPPTTAAATDYQSGRVLNCRIRQCVQGVFMGNYDSYGSTGGLLVQGNVFEDCWNHGNYLTLCEGSNITGNTYIDCQVPIVVDGTGATVVGNTLYTTEPNTRTNSLQIIQVREASNAVIADNVLIGVDAGISLECVTGTTIVGNIVKGNVIKRTARANTSFAIRFGVSAQVCKNNKITGNIITGTLGSVSGSAIEVSQAVGYTGVDNEVTDNIVDLDDAAQCLQLNLQNRAVVRGNKFRCAGDLGSGTVVRMMFVIAATNTDIRENRFVWDAGGANVTVRGIQTGGTVTGTRYEDNSFDLSAASLVAKSTIENVGGGGQSYARNRLNLTDQLSGQATITAGTSSVTVTNANVLTAYSRVILEPASAAAATAPVYASLSNGSFQILTGSGGNVASNCAYNWRIE